MTSDNFTLIPRCTESGFSKAVIPDALWTDLSLIYSQLKHNIQEEPTENIKGIVSLLSQIMWIHHIDSIVKTIDNEIKPILQTWCKHELSLSAIYGIRPYVKGSTLAPHVDRKDTHHISAILIIDKDLSCCMPVYDWGLELQDHRSKWNTIYADVGEMILYESSICRHSRVTPFQGIYFRNLFVHYSLRCISNV